MKSAHYLCLPLIAALSACSALTPPMEKPVQQDYVGSIFGDRRTNVFSLTPERRTVLVVRGVDGIQSRVMVCAEPPPDVSQNIASSIRTLAEASAKDATGRAAGASAEFSRSLNTSVASMFFRSQGIQLWRDGLFSLCQAYMNGLIADKDEFWKKHGALLDVSFALIAHEIPTVQQIRGVDLVNQVTTAKTAVEASLQEAKSAQAAAGKAARAADETLAKIRKE